MRNDCRTLGELSFLSSNAQDIQRRGKGGAFLTQQNRVPVQTHVFPGLPHGFRRFVTLPSSTELDLLLAKSILWCLSDDATSHLEVHHGKVT
jgi:hypothetical protein